MTHTSSFAQYTKELSSKKYEPLPANIEREYLFQYASGSTQAFDKLVSAHLRFIVYSLRDYKIPPTVDIMDIIQEANVGLMEGIRRFNPNKYNCRVFTYCVYWIRFYINKALVSQQQLFWTTTEEADGNKSKSRRLHGIFTPFPEDEEFAASTESVDQYYERVAEDIIAHALGGLSEREKSIVINFFGLVPPYKPKTLQEIGAMMHMNLERVRQIKNAALKKLKKDSLQELL